MAPHLDQNRSTGGTILSIIAIMFGIVACTGGLVVTLDLRCRFDINHWMPIYPESEVFMVTQSGFFRQRASGISEVIYVTQDDPDTVRAWYRAYRREITRDLNRDGQSEVAARGMATTSYTVIENPDGAGSRIIQTTECAYN